MAASSRRTRTVRLARHVTNVVVTTFVTHSVGSGLALVLHLLGIIAFGLLTLLGAPVTISGWLWPAPGALGGWRAGGWLGACVVLALAVELWERPAWLARLSRRWRFHSDSWDAPLGGERTPADAPQM